MGLVSILDIARTALSTQQYGIEVTGHNIANVNTPEYSRQSPVIVAEDPLKISGLLLGRGADVGSVVRATDQLVENRLMLEKSGMLSSQEMENYMRIFEGLFNENSDTSISALLSEFWNSWHDISNNPSGVPERIALYEQSSLLSEQLNILSQDLTQIETDLTGAVKTGIERINQLTGEIATLNRQVITVESDGNTANDLRDQRNARISELYGYLDVQTFEQDNGTITVATKRGGILVSGAESFDLSLGGTNGNRVLWENSSGTPVDITNYLTNGKLGGWLEMRDGIVAKYKLDLDAVAQEFIWSVNEQHSQGAGLEAFSTVTGTYQATDTTAALDSSGLTFKDEIVDGGFRLWVYKPDGTLEGDTTITADADTTTLTALSTSIDGIANITSSITGGRLKIDAAAGYTFAFSDDTSNVLAALGINTFFQGSSSGSIGVNTVLNDKNYIAAAQVTNNVGPAVADSGNTGTGTIVTSGHYTGTTEATYTIEILTTGAEAGGGAATFQWSDDGGSTWTGPVPADYPNAQSLGVDGVSVTFLPDTYTAGDTFAIGVTADSNSYGTFADGDNTNALAIADLQYTDTAITRTTVDRIDGNTTETATATIEGYYHATIGSIGVASSSILRAKEFNEIMVNKLSTVRDAISAVSLDEEMANLIKFQHAYAAAAKIINVVDEMYVSLLQTK
jgi:flagellar hook-associated protein 1 FlgK